jgi:hypothetical protein
LPPRLRSETLALTQPAGNGKFEVVYPETSLLLQDDSGAALDSIRDQIQGFVHIEGFKVGPLLDKLLKRNKASSRLALGSSPEQGFFIDYEGKYLGYLQGNEGDWKRMYADFPKVTAVKHVSLPSYEKGNEIVLIYICRMTYPASGSGQICVYRDNGTSLQLLGKVTTWTP